MNTDVSAAVQEALARRPDVAAARENVAAEERAVVVARRGGWPLVTLTGGYTRGVDTGIPVSGASVTVDVTLPVTGAAHDRVLAEEARLAQARAASEGRAQRRARGRGGRSRLPGANGSAKRIAAGVAERPGGISSDADRLSQQGRV
jgi:outer membrane protein TolC